MLTYLVGIVVGINTLEFNNKPNNKTTIKPVQTPPEFKTGQDYTQLKNYLAAEKWKEADEETRRVMLAVAKREKEDWLNNESIDNFPCEDLRTIDQLWVKYSDSKFGFSVQKRIYQSFGGTQEYNSDFWLNFQVKVGWRKKGDRLHNDMDYKNITFNINKAPEGHLPVRPVFGVGWDYATARIFWSRVQACKL